MSYYSNHPSSDWQHWLSQEPTTGSSSGGNDSNLAEGATDKPRRRPRPQTACLTCRTAKTGCDYLQMKKQGLKDCSRCDRLGRTCPGNTVQSDRDEALQQYFATPSLEERDSPEYSCSLAGTQIEEATTQPGSSAGWPLGDQTGMLTHIPDVSSDSTDDDHSRPYTAKPFGAMPWWGMGDLRNTSAWDTL